jgi:lysophospholipase L1-like esterase
VTFSSPTTAGGVAPVQVSCTRQSGSMFTAGPTNVQCTAIDAASTSVSCSFIVTVNAPVPRISRTRFLAFGDSLTLGEVTVPTTATSERGSQYFGFVIVPAASYPTQLLQMLRARYTEQMSILEVTNGGKSGEWAQDGALRLPGLLTSVRPEVVLILEGVNDLGATGTNGISAAAAAIQRMAADSRARGARVFLSTLTPPAANNAKAIPISQVTLLNDRIRTIAAGEGAVLVDAYVALSADLARNVGADGLHLTELGYQRLADLFLTAVRGNLEVR